MSLLQELETVEHELQNCHGELEIFQRRTSRAEAQLAAGGSNERDGP